MPESGKIYSFNEGNYDMWAPHLKAYMDSLKDGSKWGGKPYSARCLSRCSGRRVSGCLCTQCCESMPGKTPKNWWP